MSTDDILDRHGNPLEDLEGIPVALDHEGFFKAYHRTAPEVKARMIKEGRFISRESTGNVFFSTTLKASQSEGFGTDVIELRFKPEQVELDDAFRTGELHVTVPTSLASSVLRSHIARNLVLDRPQSPVRVKAYRRGGKLVKSHTRKIKDE